MTPLPLAASILAAGLAILPGDGNHNAMRGFPPPPDRIVNRANQLSPENLRWTLSHMRMILPTANIRRGTAPSSPLPAGRLLPIPSFQDVDGTSIDFEQWMRRTHADALVVLHNGKVVFEGYANGVDPNAPHTLQSISKSFIGLAAATLIHEDRIDADAPVARYVPELASSAWGEATIQQTLDMTTAVRFNENLKDPNSDIHRYYGVASGSFAPPPGYKGPLHIYEMLQRLPRDGEHGKGFIYKTVNPEAIAWVVSRVTGQKPSQFLSERIWSKLGAEEDAFVSVDPAGTDMMGGGMSATARDLARFGEMMRLDGNFNGQQIVPAAAVQDIFKGGDIEKFRADPLRVSMVDYSYHDFWWKPPTPGVIQGLGGFGQHLHVNRVAGTVIVKFSSAVIGEPYDESKRLDPIGFNAIDTALSGHTEDTAQKQVIEEL